MATSISGPAPPTVPPMRDVGMDRAGSTTGSTGSAQGGHDSADLSVTAPVGGPPPETTGILEVAHKVRDYLQIARRDLVFSVDQDTGRTVIRVLDASTGELVRQIPSKEIMALAKNLDQPGGILFRGQV